jgi:hypothetical protein
MSFSKAAQNKEIKFSLGYSVNLSKKICCIATFRKEENQELNFQVMPQKTPLVG